MIFAVRAALAPLLGLQAPLLPFLLGVLVCAYLGGRGPALLASALDSRTRDLVVHELAA